MSLNVTLCVPKPFASMCLAWLSRTGRSRSTAAGHSSKTVSYLQSVAGVLTCPWKPRWPSSHIHSTGKQPIPFRSISLSGASCPVRKGYLGKDPLFSHGPTRGKFARPTAEVHRGGSGASSDLERQGADLCAELPQGTCPPWARVNMAPANGGYMSTWPHPISKVVAFLSVSELNLKRVPELQQYKLRQTHVNASAQSRKLQKRRLFSHGRGVVEKPMSLVIEFTSQPMAGSLSLLPVSTGGILSVRFLQGNHSGFTGTFCDTNRIPLKIRK